MNIITIAAAMLVAVTEPPGPGAPDCAGPNDWPALMAAAHLKSTRIANEEELDFSKTRVLRLASEPRGKRVHRQLHLVAFAAKSGQLIHVITVNDASEELCSESAVDVFVISRQWSGT